MKEEPKLVIVVGAGSTYSDSKQRSSALRPPLGKGFFRQCRRDEYVANLFDTIKDSLIFHYKLDPIEEANDDLEYILAKVYLDVQLRSGKTDIKSREALFLDLITLLNIRLARITNRLEPTRNSGIGRIVSRYLKNGFEPKDICIITFNYDLHIEKNLLLLDDQAQFKSHKGNIFNFPHLYELEGGIRMTSPPSKEIKFPRTSSPSSCISLLKLHGSLNWISKHESANPPVSDLFNPKQDILITPRRGMNITMRLRGEQSMATYPVIIPPIVGKSAVMHQQITGLWSLAKNRLDVATEVVVFGYSFPSADYESVHLLENTIGLNKHCHHIFAINPDPSVITRMGMIPKRKPVTLFPNTKDFLDFLM
ncbi:MAG: hypothetical protein ACR2P9_05620 [Gammaproteobacteria bacterium]